MWPARFIGGRNIQQVIPVANRVIQQKKYPIINYAVEHTDKPSIVLNEHLKLVSQIDWQYKIAIKLSSFGFDEDWNLVTPDSMNALYQGSQNKGKPKGKNNNGKQNNNLFRGNNGKN